MSSPRLQLWKEIVSSAKGNLSPEIKQQLVDALAILTKDGDFGDLTISSLKATELSIFERTADGKKQARVVFELVVAQGMLNARDSIHGGCLAYLVDVCSSVALSVLGLATGGPVDLVSQAINMIYHSGAGIGDKLEIINETVSTGSRAVSAKTEIWDVTNRRLVASGTHIKMKPGVRKAKL